jgi:flagellar basal-body rod protein FlgF
MDRLIYTAMSGAKAAMHRQEVLASNLANASTNGFRAEMAAFRSVPILGDGATTRAFALETTIGYNPEPGPISPTGNPLDVAMTGNAWLAVTALDGTEAYTRSGALQVNSEGLLVTTKGLQVMGDGGPITVPLGAAVEIANNGTVSARVGEGRPQTVGRLKMVTPEQPFTRGEDGLFRAADGELPADPAARLQPAALEGSNVNPVEAMVAMIAASRQFEQQLKLLQQTEQREQNAARLLGPATP